MALVAILVALIRGDEKQRDEFNGQPYVPPGFEGTGADQQRTVVDYVPGTKNAWSCPPDERDAFDPRVTTDWPQQSEMEKQFAQSIDLPGLPDEVEAERKKQLAHFIGWPELAGRTMTGNRGKVKLIIDAKDNTKERWPGQLMADAMVEEARQECEVNMKKFKEHINKEGTDGETKLHQE